MWIKVKPEIGPKSEELQQADASKLLLWMKDGKAEMFIQNKESPIKVLPAQWDHFVQSMRNKSATK